MTTSPSRRLRLAALALALSAVTGLAGAQVFSQPDTDFKGNVRAASQVVLPGSEVELNGSGFKPGQHAEKKVAQQNAAANKPAFRKASKRG